jgi:hypothetical protein
LLNSRVESVNLLVTQASVNVAPLRQFVFADLGSRVIAPRFLFDDLYDHLLARPQGRADQVFQCLEVVGRNVADVTFRVMISMLILYLALPTPGKMGNDELR